MKKRGLELLLLFLDIMQDGVDTKVIDLLMNALKFEPFVEGNVKLPTYDVRGMYSIFTHLHFYVLLLYCHVRAYILIMIMIIIIIILQILMKKKS